VSVCGLCWYDVSVCVCVVCAGGLCWYDVSVCVCGLSVCAGMMCQCVWSVCLCWYDVSVCVCVWSVLV